MTKPSDSMLLQANLEQLRLPTIGAEFEKLAREAAASNQTFEQYLLRLTVLEVATRQSNALTAGIRQADFPVEKELENFDFSVPSAVNEQKVLELARCGPPCGRCPIARRSNVPLLGQPGTGKTHLAIALGNSAARHGHQVRFFTAAGLVTLLEEKQKNYRLDHFLNQRDRTDLLICAELGYLSFSRTGAELLFQVFADRYERRSLLITSNPAFSDWGQIFPGERLTAA